MFVKDPAIDAGDIQNPVGDPAIPLYTFVVDVVQCREHVEKVNTSHMGSVLYDCSWTLNLDRLLDLLVPVLHDLDRMNTNESR